MNMVSRNRNRCQKSLPLTASNHLPAKNDNRKLKCPDRVLLLLTLSTFDSIAIGLPLIKNQLISLHNLNWKFVDRELVLRTKKKLQLHQHTQSCSCRWWIRVSFFPFAFVHPIFELVCVWIVFTFGCIVRLPHMHFAVCRWKSKNDLFEIIMRSMHSCLCVCVSASDGISRPHSFTIFYRSFLAYIQCSWCHVILSHASWSFAS